MPIADIAVEVLEAAVRVIGRVLVEVVFEFLIQGAGDLLIRMFRPRPEPSDAACTLVGLLFWISVAIGAYFLFQASGV